MLGRSSSLVKGQGTIKLAEGAGVDCSDNLSHIGLFLRHSGRRLDID